MSGLQRLATLRAIARDRFPFGWLLAIFAALILVMPGPRHYRDFYYVALALPFLAVVRWQDLQPVARSWTFRLGLAYLGWMWLTLFWMSGTPGHEFYDVGRRILSALLFVAMTAWLTRHDERFAERLFHVMAWACLVTLLLSAWWLRWRSGLAGTRLRAWIWENPNTAGEVYGVVAVGLVSCTLRARRSKWLRSLVMALAASLAAGVVLSGSRAALIAMSVAVAAPGLISGSRRRAAGALAGIALVAIVWAAWFGIDDLRERADAQRFELWGRYWGMSLDRLWLGHGVRFDPTILLSNGYLIGDPHNMLLSGLLLGGIVGAFIVLGLFVAAGRAGWLAWRQRGEAGPLSLFLYLAVHGLVESTPMIDNADWKWIYFWLPMALIAGSESAARGAAAAEPATSPAVIRAR